MDDGEIVEIDKNDEELAKKALQSFEHSLEIRISKLNTIEDERSLIHGIEFSDNASVEKEYYSRRRNRSVEIQSIDPLSNYNLTTLATYDDAQKIMDGFNGATRDESQCYNRAHVWTYQAFTNNQVNLGKVWIFFSKKYIKEYRYKWWFHIAPFTMVEGYEKPYILDRGFTMVPYTLENWKNIYIKNQAECKTVNRYSDYTKNTNTETCFFMFSSQYYWQPKHLKDLERKKDKYQWGYELGELRHAYKDALIEWDGDLPYRADLENYNAYKPESPAKLDSMPQYERNYDYGDCSLRDRWSGKC